MVLEFTPAQIARLTAEAEAEYFSAYYDEAEEDDTYEDQYSWNKYTQTNDCEDWDQQDGTWGYIGEYAYA